MKRVKTWQAYIPGGLPDNRFYIHASGIDLRTLADEVEMAPLVEITRADATRHDLDFTQRHFIDGLHVAEFRVGANCWTYSLITLAQDHIAIAENIGGAEADVGDRLIARLVERGVAFTWSAFSVYLDSGETSEIERGTDATFRAG